MMPCVREWDAQDSMDKESYARLVGMLDGVHPRDAAILLAKVRSIRSPPPSDLYAHSARERFPALPRPCMSQHSCISQPLICS